MSEKLAPNALLGYRPLVDITHPDSGEVVVEANEPITAEESWHLTHLIDQGVLSWPVVRDLLNPPGPEWRPPELHYRYRPGQYVTTVAAQLDMRRYHEGDVVLNADSTGRIVDRDPCGWGGDLPHYYVEFAERDFVLQIPEPELRRATFVGAYLYPSEGRLSLRTRGQSVSGTPFGGWTPDNAQRFMRLWRRNSYYPLGVWMRYWTWRA